MREIFDSVDEWLDGSFVAKASVIDLYEPEAAAAITMARDCVSDPARIDD